MLKGHDDHHIVESRLMTGFHEFYGVQEIGK